MPDLGLCTPDASSILYTCTVGSDTDDVSLDSDDPDDRCLDGLTDEQIAMIFSDQ